MRDLLLFKLCLLPQHNHYYVLHRQANNIINFVTLGDIHMPQRYAQQRSGDRIKQYRLSFNSCFARVINEATISGSVRGNTCI